MMQEKHVVVIGGGPGTDIALSGLKRYTSRLTALVSTFDASSREQRQGNGAAHPADDVRSSLLALGADPATTLIMERLFAYRFAHSVGLGSQTFGNLFLSALTDITGATDLALQAAARVLNVQGQVLPLTLQSGPLIAELNDGTEVQVATPADLIAASSQMGLRRINLAQSTPLLDAAMNSIKDADIIVLGPADLYFNVLAPLLVDGLVDALAASGAVKIFVCNILTQPGTTTGWAASRFINQVLGCLGEGATLDCVIVNSTPLAPEALARKAADGAFPVQFDLEECLSLGPNVIVRPVALPNSLLHDAEKLARTILFLGGGRSARRADKRRAFPNGRLGDLLVDGALTPLGAEP